MTTSPWWCSRKVVSLACSLHDLEAATGAASTWCRLDAGGLSISVITTQRAALLWIAFSLLMFFTVYGSQTGLANSSVGLTRAFYTCSLMVMEPTFSLPFDKFNMAQTADHGYDSPTSENIQPHSMMGTVIQRSTQQKIITLKMSTS